LCPRYRPPTRLPTARTPSTALRSPVSASPTSLWLVAQTNVRTAGPGPQDGKRFPAVQDLLAARRVLRRGRHVVLHGKLTTDRIALRHVAQGGRRELQLQRPLWRLDVDPPLLGVDLRHLAVHRVLAGCLAALSVRRHGRRAEK